VAKTAARGAVATAYATCTGWARSRKDRSSLRNSNHIACRSAYRRAAPHASRAAPDSPVSLVSETFGTTAEIVHVGDVFAHMRLRPSKPAEMSRVSRPPNLVVLGTWRPACSTRRPENHGVDGSILSLAIQSSSSFRGVGSAAWSTCRPLLVDRRRIGRSGLYGDIEGDIHFVCRA